MRDAWKLEREEKAPEAIMWPSEMNRHRRPLLTYTEHTRTQGGL